MRPILAILLVACSNDFGLEGMVHAPGDDTGPADDGGQAGDGGTAGDGGSPEDSGGDGGGADGGGADGGGADGGSPDGGSADGGSADGGSADGGSADGGSGDGGGDTGDPGDGGTPDDPAPEDDCTETSDLVYVLARDDGGLYTFDPSTLAFTSLGRVSCGTGQTPGSMAVDRSGTAWVRYADNRLYAVDLATMGCSSTGYADRETGFDSFGMGYATDTAGTWREQLYVANEDTLAVLDTDDWSVRALGAMPSQSELTGNADGELWAMLPLERPAALVHLDKDDGTVLDTLALSDFPSAGDIDTFAFATWSGDFYLFVRLYGMGNTTDVYRVTADGEMSVVLRDVGFDVVGAGVSTCAPS